MKRTLLSILALILVLSVSAENETVDLNFTIYGNQTHTFNGEEEPTSWYFSDSSDDGKYMIRLKYFADELGQYGTYTNQDLDPENSYLSEWDEDWNQIDHAYVDGTEFTISEEGYTLVLTGQLVCDNGVTYILHGNIEKPTYNIEANDFYANYNKNGKDWYVTLADYEYKVKLDLSSPTGEFTGTYSMADVAGTACVEDQYSYEEDPFTELNVTVSMPEGITDPNVGCEVTGTGIGESGNTYNFHYKLVPPLQPKKVVDLEVNVDSAQWPAEAYGSSYYELSEKENPDEKWTLQFWNLTGKYSENGLNLQVSKRYNSVTGEEQTVDHGTVSQTFDSEAMKVLVKVELVMSDTIQYNISFENPVEPKGEVSYSFTNLDIDNSSVSWGDYRTITASNDEASMEVTINNADVPGEYDSKNVNISLCVKNEEGGENYLSTLTIFNASTTIDENNNTVFKARMLASDMNIYNLEACFIMPEAKDTLTITMANISISDWTDYDGGFYISGQTDDNMTSVWMGVGSTQIPGHYTIQDINSYSHGSGLTFYDMDYNETSKAVFYDADFDVTLEGRVITLTGDFQAGTHFVHLTLTGKMDVPGAIDNDNDEEGIDVSFTPEDLVAIKISDGIGVELHNAERNDVFETVFHLDSYEGLETVPEGVYGVSEWYENQCVEAGECYGTSIYPTYYGTFDDEGLVNTPLWFLTSGTVTVSRNNGELAFEVNGYNSYSLPFHVAYNLPSEGISNVTAETAKAKAKKYVKDGQLVISKAGKQYNAIGQLTK